MLSIDDHRAMNEQIVSLPKQRHTKKSRERTQVIVRVHATLVTEAIGRDIGGGDGERDKSR